MLWLWLLLLTGLVMAAVASLMWYRRLRQSLAVFKAAAEELAAGHFGRKLFAPRGGVLAELAEAFNLMSEGLADRFARLEEEHQQLRGILGGMVEGVVALDAQQRILFANERALQLLELGNGPLVGRPLWEVVRQRAVQELVDRALVDSRPHRQELEWKGFNDKSLAAYAVPLPRSQSRGVVVVLHDISELRRLERVRQEFFANVSHELKTPLAVIVACVETLLDGAINDPEHRGPFLEQIADQAHRLHALILDMLSLARLESGTEVFEIKALPLESVIAACLDRHRARAESNRQTVEALPATEPLAAWADEEAVSHILDNLVDNALKYTPPGGRITVRCYSDDSHVVLEVRDTGIGIPERDLPRIFERFYRVDKARSRELGGTGLGLSIVKHLVQAMQGTVRATSQLGQGSTFVVRLPAAPVVEPATPGLARSDH